MCPAVISDIVELVHTIVHSLKWGKVVSTVVIMSFDVCLAFLDDMFFAFLFQFLQSLFLTSLDICREDCSG